MDDVLEVLLRSEELVVKAFVATIMIAKIPNGVVVLIRK